MNDMQAGLSLAGHHDNGMLDQGPGSLQLRNGHKWGDCNGHTAAPDQAPLDPPAPGSAIRVVLLAGEDSHAPLLAAALPHDWAQNGAHAAAANGTAMPPEGNLR